MSIPGNWSQNQANRISFVMVDGAGNEVAGIGDGNLTIQLSKNGAAFAGAAGTDTEISDGWYTYLSTAGEADTPGTVSVQVDGAGAVQQNLEYVVRARNVAGVEFTYTVTSSVPPNNPIEGANISISTDLAGNNTIWRGVTDAFGVARDATNNELPFLDPGTYYFWTQKSGFTFSNPDTEEVS
ncbi:MAG: hypothetical protein ACYTFW_06575 [Planctomycetota bacterium]|jgi:hypothetical protein